MPAKNAIKDYAPDSFYHVYNRGVEKRNIFLDDQDFAVFLSYLKTYLLPKDTQNLQAILSSQNYNYSEKDKARKLLSLKNFSDEIELHSFALLPNHFHFLIKQRDFDSMNRFISSLAGRYSGYFNKKYKRVGKLFQGVYKAVMINTDEQLLHLSRYIHLNPFLWLGVPVTNWREISLPSSFPNYIGQTQTNWLHTEEILNYFKKDNRNLDYFDFVRRYAEPEIIAPIGLDFTD